LIEYANSKHNNSNSDLAILPGYQIWSMWFFHFYHGSRFWSNYFI